MKKPASVIAILCCVLWLSGCATGADAPDDPAVVDEPSRNEGDLGDGSSPGRGMHGEGPADASERASSRARGSVARGGTTTDGPAGLPAEGDKASSGARRSPVSPRPPQPRAGGSSVSDPEPAGEELEFPVDVAEVRGWEEDGPVVDCPVPAPGEPKDAQGCALFSGVQSGVQFVGMGAELTPEAEASLDRLALALLQYPEVVIEVRAHVGSLKDPVAAEELSRRRTLATARHLANRGVPTERLQARAFGNAASVPAEDSGNSGQATDTGEAAIDRIEFEVVSER